ncbi:acyltransferase family protein [uncultured Fibrobacter sp.]|uniref:acyltransferase family protein n=1 Tax=uncultured Fibrobacter sp. TaxID=261512 RepID=UPI0025EA9378|nr:acyltransferase family protein [uncultured Fibrobacter sp.]
MGMEAKRLDYVDIAKGLAMLAIVWGHIMLVGWSHDFVYGFHIFIFFFLSGMMFRKEKYDSVLSLIKKRYRTLLIPYFILSVVTWVIWAAYIYVSHSSVESYFMPLLETFIAQGSGGYLVHNVPLWFIPCLLFVEIVYFFICKHTKPALNIAICVLCAFVGYWMVLPNEFFDFTKLPWNIEAGLSALIFYSLGNLLITSYSHQKLIDLTNNRKALSALIVVVFTIFLLIGASYNGHVTLGTNIFGKNPFAFYFTGVCGTISTITFSLLLSFVKRDLFAKKMVMFVRWIGQNSLYFLAIHCPLKGFVVVAIAKVLGLSKSRMVQENMSLSLVTFVITIIITSMIVVLINKWRCFYKQRFLRAP